MTPSRSIVLTLSLSLFFTPFTAVPAAAQAARAVFPTDRTVLPIPEPANPPITEVDARKATPPPRFEVEAPASAPNVLIILIDDMGFGQSSAFGGPNEGAAVGLDDGTPVTEAYKVPFKFTGKIAKATVELKDVKAADRNETEQARTTSVLKKALAD
jgi:hypothetical protein